MQWAGVGFGFLVVVGVGLVVLGRLRWQAATRALLATLEAVRQPSAVGRYHEDEIAGLPVPVQRYFRVVLTDGQRLITSASFEMVGTMNMSATGAQWRPFSSTQRAVTPRPGFLWNGRVSLVPGVSAYVRDSYIAGEG